MKNNIKILLATYNGERYIKDQILSILAQEEVELSITITDDGSVDNTEAIVQNNFPDLHVLKNTPSTGSAANNFLKMVKELDFREEFEYVAFSDQDDIWLSQKLKVATTCLELNRADLYCSNLTKWDTAKNTFSLLKKDFPQKKFDFLFEGGSAGCTYVFTKKLGIQLQQFLSHIDSTNWKGFSHDWLIYFFARSQNFKVIIDSDSHIHYRLHDANVHGHLNQISFNTIRQKTGEVLNDYYQHHVKNYIKYLDRNSEEYKIYQKFLGNYFQRNFVIWKYNTQLMRDKKKFLVFAILNLLKIR
ncbi:glycosyltransferase [Flavobacterium qiangtangense]|uniref:Glycosyltransferase n=1 Tax=Flavobacterium qiangtangense TaxID=1442595 RepID=A0ABW1PT53_9FLAO